MTHTPDQHKEIMVLGHKPWPGFKTAFFAAFIIGCIYLGFILYSSFSKLPVHG